MADENANALEQTAEGALEEQYFKTLQGLEEGQMINGTVVQISTDNVFVDVGYKSEGKIPIGEFQTLPKIGEQVSVVLVRKESRDGSIAVSKAKADEKIFWRNLRKAHAEKLPVDGKIVAQVKGGYNVDLGSGVSGFLPLSKTDVYRVNNVEEYVGLQSKFALERLFSNGKVNIVLSRRAWLEEEYKRRREEFFSKTQIGDEVEGKVKSFTSFGAFIDLGGFDGLLHINDMSWGHVNTPKEYVKLGDTIQLKVISLDPENQRINLCLKHFTEDPWNRFEEKLPERRRRARHGHQAHGLRRLHRARRGHRRPRPHLRVLLGQAGPPAARDAARRRLGRVMILEYDVTQGKVSLGLKQVHDNPWSDIDARYPVGMRITRKVKNLAASGAFFELEEGIDGFLHLDDFSWTKHLKHPVGGSEGGRRGRGHGHRERQGSAAHPARAQAARRGPVEEPSARPSRGAASSRALSPASTDFGVFVKVQGDIEGLIATKSLYDSPQRDPRRGPRVASRTATRSRRWSIEVNPARQKLALSIVDFIRRIAATRRCRSIMQSEGTGDTVTLGDLLKDKLSDS